MPRGRKVDQEQALATLREIRDAMTNEGKSISEARRDAGVSSSNYSRWDKRFGHLLEPAQPQAVRPRLSHRSTRAAVAAVGRRKGIGKHRRVAQGPLTPAPFVAGLRATVDAEVRELRELVVDQALMIARLRKQNNGSAK